MLAGRPKRGCNIEGDFVLKELCELWLKKIRKSLEHKKEHFQDDADTAFRFFNGPHDFMYAEDATAEIPQPAFKMTSNRVAEMVQIFGPTLYHTNPTRQVNPRPVLDLPYEVFGDQMVAEAFSAQDSQRAKVDLLRAKMLEKVLNWIPQATDLRSNSRRSVDEAIIKGRGLLWVEMWQPPGASFKIAGNFHDSVDNLAIDPDMESLSQAQWIARLCCHPVWMVEKIYGLKPGSVKANGESRASQAIGEIYDQDGYKRKSGLSNDLLRYWKVYSRMGLGGRLSESVNGKMGSSLDIFGDYVYLVVADGVPYPLNLPPDLQEKPGADGSDPTVVKAITDAVKWPVPSWSAGLWPVTPLDFHEVPRSCWPMSHLKPGMGELRFLNWIYSFLAGKIRNTSRDFVVCLKEAAEEIKTTLLSGADLTLIEIESQYKSISDLVQFLQHPQINPSITQIIEIVETNFEKRMGLNELSYGSTDRQIRSATEADVKTKGTAVRPDDMAECVESWMTEAARKEGAVARLYMRSADVAPILGDLGGIFWDQFLATDDVNEAFHEFEYRIEAGSVRKPNKDRDAANFNQAMQILLPLYQGFAMNTGNIGPLNALIKGWCETKGMNPSPFMIPPPPPPPPPPGAPPAGGPPGPPPSLPSPAQK